MGQTIRPRRLALTAPVTLSLSWDVARCVDKRARSTPGEPPGSIGVVCSRVGSGSPALSLNACAGEIACIIRPTVSHDALPGQPVPGPEHACLIVIPAPQAQS